MERSQEAATALNYLARCARQDIVAFISTTAVCTLRDDDCWRQESGLCIDGVNPYRLGDKHAITSVQKPTHACTLLTSIAWQTQRACTAHRDCSFHLTLAVLCGSAVHLQVIKMAVDCEEGIQPSEWWCLDNTVC